ncbi:MAG: exo-alpha-sialidase [Clostridia bacterium]|nr:exo-alpha-sialidase [Clostridia bacterium]
MRLIDTKCVWSPDATYQKHRIPGMIVTDKGTLLAYTEARTEDSDWARMDILLYRSTDHGESFGAPIVLAHGTDAHKTVNNPVMMQDKEGNIHFLHAEDYGINGGRILHYTSSDDGLTWSLPQDITYATFPSMRNAFALGPGHGICTHDGILLVPVWMVPKEFGQPVDSHVPSIISTLYSLDSGKTWDMGEMLGDTEEIVSPNETVAAELPDGQIYLNIRNMTNYRARAYSVTGIDEWTEYGRDKDLPDPVCFGSVIRFQADLYFVNCNSTERRANVCLRKSSDGGRTWPALLPIDKDRGGYAEIAADETVPLIYVLYEEDGGTCCHLARIDPT